MLGRECLVCVYIVSVFRVVYLLFNLNLNNLHELDRHICTIKLTKLNLTINLFKKIFYKCMFNSSTVGRLMLSQCRHMTEKDVIWRHILFKKINQIFLN